MKNILSLLVAVATMVGYAANTWYVDDDNYKKDFTAADYIAAGFDGTDKAKAFGTIQAAIDAASTKANDTILVCPGEYNQGVSNLVVQGNDCGACRINAHKSVRIESIEGAEKTHIVGAWDPDTETGRGPKAIRCIGNWASRPIVKGFTIRDGATDAVLNENGEASNTTRNRGGAAYSYRQGDPICIVDCVVSNCNSSGGGTFHFGSVIRSLIVDNYAIWGAGGLQTTLYSCIISRNHAPNWLIYGQGTSLSHCTIAYNTAYRTVLQATNSCNNIIIESASSTGDPEISGYNLSGNVCGLIHGSRHFIAPIAGDFSILKGSIAETICSGAPADGSDFHNPIPEEFRGFDFYGNPIGENCVAGAVQKVVEPTGGAILFNNISKDYAIEVDGWRCQNSGAYGFPSEYRRQFKVSTRFKTGKIYEWTTSSAHGEYRVPDAFTDTVHIMSPLQKDLVMTNTYKLAVGETWVDPQKGNDDSGKGTFDNPYKTLQKAHDSSSAYMFVYCKGGSYDSGDKKYWSNDVSSRVCVSKSLRFVAVDGAANTFIVGKADANSPVESQPGCGSDAVRGIAAGNYHIVFEGFTFRNCHTLAKKADDSPLNGHQGCVMRAAGSVYVSMPTLMDCVIEGTCGAASNAITGGRVIRCLFKDIKSGSPAYSTTVLSACVLENCTNSKDWPDGVAFNCTLRNSGIFGKNFACVASGGARAKKVTYAGSLIFGFNTYDTGVSGLVKDKDPQFVSATGPKILRSSPAFTCGEVPADKNYGTNYYIYASTDYYGRPITFIDGKPVAGADMLGVFSMFDKRGLEVMAASAKVVQLQDGKIDLPAGCTLSAGIPATESEVKEYFITVTVADGAELGVTLDGAASTYGSGTHLLRVKSLSAARDIVFSSIGGLVEIESIKRIAGMYLILR